MQVAITIPKVLVIQQSLSLFLSAPPSTLADSVILQLAFTQGISSAMEINGAWFWLNSSEQYSLNFLSGLVLNAVCTLWFVTRISHTDILYLSSVSTTMVTFFLLLIPLTFNRIHSFYLISHIPAPAWVMLSCLSRQHSETIICLFHNIVNSTHF